MCGTSEVQGGGSEHGPATDEGGGRKVDEGGEVEVKRFKRSKANNTGLSE